MDEDSRKAKKAGIGVFLLFLCIALVCFGIAAYLIFMSRSGAVVGKWTADICKIVVLIGIFFLVVDFGYVFPSLLSGKNGKVNTRETAIFSETNMRQALEKYIPDGETLLAGIHAISKETVIKVIFSNCARTGNGLVPYENGGIIVNKEKYAGYDLYIGITQYSLVITECERNKYYYQFEDIPGVRGDNIQEVTSEILFTDIGKCFPLADIKSCEIKNGWLGSVKCFITMKNGSYFKLMFPKFGGVGGGMPHHTQYREAIIARLGGRKA